MFPSVMLDILFVDRRIGGLENPASTSTTWRVVDRRIGGLENMNEVGKKYYQVDRRIGGLGI